MSNRNITKMFVFFQIFAPVCTATMGGCARRGCVSARGLTIAVVTIRQFVAQTV